MQLQCVQCSKNKQHDFKMYVKHNKHTLIFHNKTHDFKREFVQLVNSYHTKKQNVNKSQLTFSTIQQHEQTQPINIYNI